VSRVLVVVVICAIILVLVLSLFLPKVSSKVWTRSTEWKHFGVKGVTLRVYLITWKWVCKKSRTQKSILAVVANFP
jgi:preprotein translocase subunit Sec63